MKARLLDIEKKKVTFKTEDGKFITVPRKKIKFNCEIGQAVIIERNNDEIYIVPDDADSFKKGNDIKLKGAKAKTAKKRSKKTKIITAIIVLCTVIAIPASVFLINTIKENKRANQLENCLNDANVANLKNQYSEKIECYKSYGSSDASSIIAEYEKKLKEALAHDCYFKAVNDYTVSDEEWENAKNDMNAGLVLFKRVKNGYEAQKACYKDIKDYDTSKIEANIKDAQSKIEYVEGLLKTSYPSSRQSLYCTTNTIGNYTYTSCY